MGGMGMGGGGMGGIGGIGGMGQAHMGLTPQADLLLEPIHEPIYTPHTPHTYVYVETTPQYLRDVVSWLMINSMRVDGVQYNLLCEQSVGNIWRKRCFR
jgi:hypothetical protein